MAYLLFIDESGQDHRESPYEVLAGAAIHDSRLWDFVCDVRDAEEHIFGRSIAHRPRELKARELLKRKTFRLAGQVEPIPADERARLSSDLLMDPAHPTREQLAAHAQAKLAFAQRVLELCGVHGVRLFASIVKPLAPRPTSAGLRKDYGYLFERFFYWVDEQPNFERGLVVFDELERSQSHVLVGQMSAYFRETATGVQRSGRIVPEPFFVHSDLTTGIRVADLVAYLLVWNVRVGDMSAPQRQELSDLGRLVLQLRHRATVARPGYPDGFSVWSFAVIDDLRTRDERQGRLRL
ncbi:MAG: DUF3800 domain-containing protein [Dehalococcoidia bacterium]